MLVAVHGKGRKDRKVPFSFEMRRILYNHMKAAPDRYVFGILRRHRPIQILPVGPLGKRPGDTVLIGPRES